MAPGTTATAATKGATTTKTTPAGAPAFDWAGTAAALSRDGYCVVPGVLDAAMLARVRGVSAALLAAADPEHRAAQRATGSLIQLADDPRFAGLIAWAPALEALARLGLGGAKYNSGYVISKPAGGPPLFWHQDWWGWDHPLSYTDRMLQVFVMYYLTDTTEANGCLRVIPGSHRHRHPCHALLGRAHAQDLALARDLTDPAFGPMPGAVSVPVSAGAMPMGHDGGRRPPAAQRACQQLRPRAHPVDAVVPPAVRHPARPDPRPHRPPDRHIDAPRGGRHRPERRRRAVPRRLAARSPRHRHLAAYDGPDAPQPWNRVPDGRLT